VVSAPALSRRWWASEQGAFTRDTDDSVREIQVSGVSRLEDASISFNSIRQWDQAGLLEPLIALTRKVWRDRAYGVFFELHVFGRGAYRHGRRTRPKDL